MLGLKLNCGYLCLVKDFRTTFSCMRKEDLICFGANHVPCVISSSTGGKEIGD
jgi:hypothetical protein